MFDHQLYIQSPTFSGEIRRGLVSTATVAPWGRLLAAIAYATGAGARLLSELLAENVPDWEDVRKEWLISIEDGVTEPAALQVLSALPNSGVRVHRAEEALSAGLRFPSRFHHKAYLFDAGPGSDELAVFSGSANLTYGGLHVNDEQAVSSVWRRPLETAERSHHERAKRWRSLLEEKIRGGSPLTGDLLDRYAEMRGPRRPEDHDDVLRRIDQPDPVVGLPQAAALASARAFWVEVWRETENLGSGRPGNQIDLARGSRVFFGYGSENVPPNTIFGSVSIRYRGEPTACTVRFGNNHMDKLNLPIPGQSGPSTYRNKTLLFEKQPDGTYGLSADAGRQAEMWKRRSEGRGTSYSMRGGRRYGVL